MTSVPVPLFTRVCARARQYVGASCGVSRARPAGLGAHHGRGDQAAARRRLRRAKKKMDGGRVRFYFRGATATAPIPLREISHC
jgi:hypothetical protein